MHAELIETTKKFLTMLEAQESSDPHAENKALYAKDAAVHKEPWKLWECLNPRNIDKEFKPLYGHPSWREHVQYRRKQTKQLVGWIPLCKGASTNFGELFQHSKGTTAWLYGNGMWIGSRELRLAHTHVTPSNWQAYNGEDLIALHEAGFVVEVRYWEAHSEKYVHVPLEHYLSTPVKYLAAYRVIAIRDGFTDNPAEVV